MGCRSGNGSKKMKGVNPQRPWLTSPQISLLPSLPLLEPGSVLEETLQLTCQFRDMVSKPGGHVQHHYLLRPQLNLEFHVLFQAQVHANLKVNVAMNGNSAVSQEPAHTGMLQLSALGQTWPDRTGGVCGIHLGQLLRSHESRALKFQKFHPLGDKLAYVCSL